MYARLIPFDLYIQYMKIGFLDRITNFCLDMKWHHIPVSVIYQTESFCLMTAKLFRCSILRTNLIKKGGYSIIIHGYKGCNSQTEGVMKSERTDRIRIQTIRFKR